MGLHVAGGRLGWTSLLDDALSVGSCWVRVGTGTFFEENLLLLVEYLCMLLLSIGLLVGLRCIHSWVLMAVGSLKRLLL